MNAISKACVSKKVKSVNKMHFANGIFAIFMFFVVEAMSAYNLLINDLRVSIAVAVIMQITAIYFIMYAAKHLIPYTRSSEFELHFTRLANITDAATLQTSYYIMKIDDYGVLFTDKSFQRAAKDWLLVSKGTSTRSIEMYLALKS